MKTRFARHFRSIIILMVVLVLSGAPVTVSAQKQEAPIKNVILLIGDGMGAPQRRIAGIVEGRGNPDHKLMMETFPTVGLGFNHPTDGIVTDSAASGTAISCGKPTKNGVIAMSPDGRTSYRTILEACRDKGMSTGLITTVGINEATPAVFASHVSQRKDFDRIINQYAESGVDVLMGGGWFSFLPPGGGYRNLKGRRTDGRNMVDVFIKKGYAFATDRKEFLSIDPLKTGKFLALFAPGAMAYEIDRNPELEPSLAEMTDKAIRILAKNEKGFFLMVEGGKIDWACHGHDVAGSVYDTLAFDRAVRVARVFADRKGHTLVIVVNDHETGGMCISPTTRPDSILKLKASGETMQNLIKKDGSNIREVFLKYAGIDDLKNDEVKYVADEVSGRSRYKDSWGYGGSIISDIISRRTGIRFSTGGHSGTYVVLAAYGPGSRNFDGFYHISQIPLKIAGLLKIKFP